MKKNYAATLCALSLLLLVSCKPTHIQLVRLESNNAALNAQRDMIFENDSVRIKYNFYSESGNVQFSIFNKLDRPLYANWKESAYIVGSSFSNYWQDKYVVDGFMYNRWFEWNQSLRNRMTNTGNLFAVAKREDAVSFIPPKSELHQMVFSVLPPKAYYQLNTLQKGALEKIVENANSSKPIGVRAVFKDSVSPTRFRQFLTFSTDAEGKNRFTVENQFWVGEIVEVPGTYVYGSYYGSYSLKTLVGLVPPASNPQIAGTNTFVVVARPDEGNTNSSVKFVRKRDYPVRLWRDVRKEKE